MPTDDMEKERTTPRRLRAYFGADNQAPFLALSAGGTLVLLECGGRGDDPLVLFDRGLKRAKARIEDVAGVVVDRGPDGFSSVRRRVAVAAAIAAALKLPLAGVDQLSPEQAAALPDAEFRAGAFVVPSYDRAPNITSSRRDSPLKRHSA